MLFVVTSFSSYFSAHVVADRANQRAVNASVAAAAQQANATFIPGQGKRLFS